MLIKKAWIRILWLLIAVSALIFALLFRNDEGGLFIFSLLMLVISFPLGAAIATLIWFVNTTFEEILAEGSVVEICVYWLALVLSGYIQWFSVVPYLFSQRSKKHKLRPSGS